MLECNQHQIGTHQHAADGSRPGSERGIRVWQWQRQG